MCEDEGLKQPTPQEKPMPVIRPGVEKKQINEIYKKERETPLSWQPVTDQTDPTPPDGGSGVGDS